jgi:hypothetical protein
VNASVQPVAEPTADPSAVLLWGAGIPAVTVAAAVSLGALLAGPSEASSTALGAVLAIAALAAGPLLLRLGRGYSPPGLLTLAVCGYGLVVTVLGLAYVLVSEADWLAGGYAGIGALTAAGVWLAGQARSTARLRVLTYGAGEASVARPVEGPDSGQLPTSGKETRGGSR